MMDYEQIQEVIAAHRAGWEIEYRRNNSAVEGHWLNWQYSKGRFDFNFYSYDYRIKPEPPKPREWWLVQQERGNWLAYNCRQVGGLTEQMPQVHVREILP